MNGASGEIGGAYSHILIQKEMTEGVQIAVYRGNGVVDFPSRAKGREVVLALPLDRLLATVVKAQAADIGSAREIAAEALKRMSPYPDDPLAVSCEQVRETEEGALFLAAAFPDQAAGEDLLQALDAAKASVKRVDALAFGALRAFAESGAVPPGSGSRSIFLFDDGSAVAAFVLDGATPVAVRALSPESDMRREIFLMLVEAEDNAGPGAPQRIYVSGNVPSEGLETIVPGAAVEILDSGVSAEAALGGVEERALDPAALDALPESWAEELAESRFKRKMKTFLAVAGGIWLAVVVVLAGVPKMREYRAGRYATMCAEHKTAYRKVSEKKSQVESVRSVSNHDQGALETLRAVSGVMPEGVTLSKWSFKRGDRLSFSGTAENSDQRRVYEFKDGLAGVRLSEISENEEDDETPFFTEVTLPRGVVSRGDKAAFDVECSFKQKEDE